MFTLLTGLCIQTERRKANTKCAHILILMLNLELIITQLYSENREMIRLAR